MIIVHALPAAEWEEAKAKGSYGEDSLRKYGFIHCSPIGYIVDVANYNFKGVHGLILLCIEDGRVEAEIRWEDFDGFGRFYPHIYGMLNFDAVVAVIPFEPDAEGYFSVPQELEAMREDSDRNRK